MGQTVNLLAYAFGGSNPSLPTKNCGSSSVDRALAFQAEGRGFEPRLPLSKEESKWIPLFLFSISIHPNLLPWDHEQILGHEQIITYNHFGLHPSISIP